MLDSNEHVYWSGLHQNRLCHKFWFARGIIVHNDYVLEIMSVYFCVKCEASCACLRRLLPAQLVSHTNCCNYLWASAARLDDVLLTELSVQLCMHNYIRVPLHVIIIRYEGCSKVLQLEIFNWKILHYLYIGKHTVFTFFWLCCGYDVIIDTRHLDKKLKKYNLWCGVPDVQGSGLMPCASCARSVRYCFVVLMKQNSLMKVLLSWLVMTTMTMKVKRWQMLQSLMMMALKAD